MIADIEVPFLEDDNVRLTMSRRQAEVLKRILSNIGGRGDARLESDKVLASLTRSGIRSARDRIDYDNSTGSIYFSS